jgi:hypothetical protein
MVREFSYRTRTKQSQDSAVGKATGYGLEGREVEVQVSVGATFSLLPVVQTGSGVHPTSYPTPAVKWPGHEPKHSPPASVEVKKVWIYTSTPPYAFMAQCLIS